MVFIGALSGFPVLESRVFRFTDDPLIVADGCKITARPPFTVCPIF
jgi:hypothetical protein